MGNLTPGAKYIYERVDGNVYARKEGETERTLIGYAYTDVLKHKGSLSIEEGLKNWREEKLWQDIFEKAKTDEKLNDALERVKILYYLGLEENGGKTRD